MRPFIPPRHRRRFSLALGIVGFAFGCGAWLMLALHAGRLAWDFTAFYIAGNIPIDSIYNPHAFLDRGRELLGPIGVTYYPPYVRPAIFATPLRTITWLPYWTAFGVWAILLFTCYLVTLYSLFRWLQLPPLLIAAFGFYFPVFLGTILGQDTTILLLMLSCAIILLSKGKQWQAGILLALALYKFGLILLLPVFLLVKKQLRALFWFCLVGFTLAAVSALITPPEQYLQRLRTVPQYVIDSSISGLRGFTDYVGLPALYPLLAAVVALLCLVLASRLPLIEAFCVVLTGSLLCTYTFCWYDATLFVIPIAVAWRRGDFAIKLVCLAFLLLTPLWFLQRPVLSTSAGIFCIFAIAWPMLRSPRSTSEPTSIGGR